MNVEEYDFVMSNERTVMDSSASIQVGQNRNAAVTWREKVSLVPQEATVTYSCTGGFDCANREERKDVKIYRHFWSGSYC